MIQEGLTPKKQPMLQAVNLTKRYEDSVLAVDNVDFSVYLGQLFAMLGGNGAGKPSVDEVAAKKASFDSGLWKDFRVGMASFKAPETNKENDIEGLMSQFNKFTDSLTAIRDEKMNEFAGRLNEERINRQKVQRTTALNLARLSPTASLDLATAELAGTSISLKSRYRDAALAYQKKYAEFMHEKTGMNVGGRMIVMKMEIDG
ncbi:MAG: DUF3526 domain-containing protein [bacterium]|nr:DUF3526 domain-containing protein [bacterium]